MSSYKPPFARRLQRNTNVKPIVRTAKPKTSSIATVTTTSVNNVSEAIDALGLTEEVVAVEETTVAEVEVADTVTVEEVVEDVAEVVEWSMKNTKKELLAAASDLGLGVSDTNTKSEILSAINGDGAQ